jgi:tRNA pseudouridine32 synthase/23S rRNA pseudouridine746 synthase
MTPQEKPERRSFHYAPPPKSAVTILHRDDDILVVSKPEKLLSVPGRDPAHHTSLLSYLQDDFPAVQIVHRLDMETSGIMVLGLNAKAHRHLSIQFQNRETQKTYIAQIWGTPDGTSGLVDLPLICDWPNRPLQKVDHEVGKPSQTQWKIIESNEIYSRVKLTPITGRSHQLRVHMMELGHPILGDEFYAHDEAYGAAARLMLHAQDLSFQHPSTGEQISFTSPCPF